MGFSFKWSLRLSHIAAGFIAVLVGYTSSAAIVVQAAGAAGATPAQISSWLLVLGLGMGVTCIGLSCYYRVPVLTAWSTPGAALLATSLMGVPLGEATAAFMLASFLMLVAGFTGSFDRLLRFLPTSLAAAMLAGVLLRFGMDAFAGLPKNPLLVGSMVLTLLMMRQFSPRYAVPAVFGVGLGVAAFQGQINTDLVQFVPAQIEWVRPEVHFTSLLGVGLPLFVVTMASQNVPGVAVLRANGYSTPAGPLIGWTGLTGFVLAPFGGFSFNLAAITAAICMSRESDPDPARRYGAAVWAGIFYLITAALGGSVTLLFSALPGVLVLGIAGLALLGTIGSSLSAALKNENEREAAMITFLVTASGLVWGGIGSAFWGLVFGVLALTLARWRREPS